MIVPDHISKEAAVSFTTDTWLSLLEACLNFLFLRTMTQITAEFRIAYTSIKNSPDANRYSPLTKITFVHQLILAAMATSLMSGFVWHLPAVLSPVLAGCLVVISLMKVSSVAQISGRVDNFILEGELERRFMSRPIP